MVPPRLGTSGRPAASSPMGTAVARPQSPDRPRSAAPAEPLPEGGWPGRSSGAPERGRPRLLPFRGTASLCPGHPARPRAELAEVLRRSTRSPKCHHFPGMLSHPPREVVVQGEGDQDRQPEERRAGEDPDQPFAVADVHEDQDDQHRLDAAIAIATGKLNGPRSMKRDRDRQHQQDHQRGVDRSVGPTRDDVRAVCSLICGGRSGRGAGRGTPRRCRRSASRARSAPAACGIRRVNLPAVGHVGEHATRTPRPMTMWMACRPVMKK